MLHKQSNEENTTDSILTAKKGQWKEKNGCKLFEPVS